VRLSEEIPDWAGPDGDMDEWEGWTVSLVRECISAIVSVAGEDDREPTPAMASSSKGKWGREYVLCPASSIRYMRPYAISSSMSWS
jgi:hypothetical protein